MCQEVLVAQRMDGYTHLTFAWVHRMCSFTEEAKFCPESPFLYVLNFSSEILPSWPYKTLDTHNTQKKSYVGASNYSTRLVSIVSQPAKVVLFLFLFLYFLLLLFWLKLLFMLLSLLVFCYTRSLPLKFCQKQVSNSWDMSDLEFVWWVGGWCQAIFVSNSNYVRLDWGWVELWLCWSCDKNLSLSW